MNFEELIQQIENIHIETQKYAVQQVNSSLTIRNILIGFFIVEFEQNGFDRADYGANTINQIAKRVNHIKGISAPQLYRFRDLYLSYPHILSAVLRKLENTSMITPNIFSTVSRKLEIMPKNELSFDPEMLLTRLSFSHFVELLNAETVLKRSFYEVQTIKNNWSARELARAMNTLLFERTGLSKEKEKVIQNFKNDHTNSINEVIKNPYFLKFIGLKEKNTYNENELETAIINNLQDFLTELGRGFCFEARQKRITFDNKHFRIDLVFYHRILKCHVLIDLKIGAFDHIDAGQMNLYLNYYRKNEMTDDDNPPVGIILCANKNETMVEYATAGLTNDVFVSKYQIELPSKKVLENFIRNEMKME